MILNFHQWCKLDQYVRARESGGIRQCRTPTHRGSVRAREGIPRILRHAQRICGPEDQYARARGNPNLIEQNLVAQIEPLKFEFRQ
ncbi:hypothetical protein DPV80_08005 [Haemophilus sputorum]|uniref:Uncharacterized protein n=1 Tax=Haemophilus sputorum TaxID=1078480 RepID=A0ABX9HQA4_9PAST|nr:hypothetical protein DPV80_08005 [Haemophilus sputorum]RDF10981.1 hypothetical protein DPV84_06490 [Haemophilus sputorum]